MDLIKISELYCSYSSVPVLSDINFNIQKGMYLCFFGENGSGKSTLMKAILGLVPIQKGKIETQKGLEIGYLPQQTPVQRDFPASVFEVALSGFVKKKGFRPFYSKSMKHETMHILETVGMEKFAHRSYKELSGGQQQRILLARALAASKDILMLDEPVTALDPVASAEFYDIIRKLNKNGCTIVMVSHDIKEALKDATHVLHIRDNKAEFFGTKEDYINSAYGKYYLQEEKQ